MMMIYSVRGAISIEKNSPEKIELATCELLNKIIIKNNIDINNITQVIFSATKDITKAYPAYYARKMGINNACFMCVQEMYVEGSLDLCIRVLLNFIDKPGKNIFHVYLGKAKILRPDLD